MLNSAACNVLGGKRFSLFNMSSGYKISPGSQQHRPLALGRPFFAVAPGGIHDGEGETVETVRVMDWNEPGNNDLLLASQFWVPRSSGRQI